MRKTTLLLLLIALFVDANGQYNIRENDVWVFGGHVLLDFSSGSPVGGSSGMSSNEGTASVANSDGQLLFYTEGNKVYNRLNVLMPTGTSVFPYATASSIQSSTIVPFPNDTSKYYLFSVGDSYTITGPDFCHIGYSVIDMSLDGGLGDAVPGSTGIVLNDNMCEKIIGIRGPDCNAWVVSHKKYTNQFVVYEVTNSGVSLPSTYATGFLTGATAATGMYDGYMYGALSASHDGRKIFISSNRVSLSTSVSELCDFDPVTGSVSGCKVIDSSHAFYGAEFSPDDSKIYASEYIGSISRIMQFDISLPTWTAVQASKTVIPDAMTTSPRRLRLARDGKIYIPHDMHMDRIDTPNNPAAACGYVHSVVSFPSGGGAYGLPNEVPVVRKANISGPTSLCLGNTYSYVATGVPGYWHSSNTYIGTIDSVTGILIPLMPGIDTISYISTGCEQKIIVTVNPQPAILGDISSLCERGVLTLANAVSGGTWNSSDTLVAAVDTYTGEVTGIAPGTTIVTYAIGACIVTANLNVLPSPPPVTGVDRLCVGDTTSLSDAMPGGHWISSNPTVAEVDYYSGKAYGVSGGTATISYLSPANGCPAEYILTVDCRLIVNESKPFERVTVYPVPFHDRITISFQHSVAPSEITVVLQDALGHSLMSHTTFNRDVELSLPFVEPGIYFLVIADSDGFVSRKKVIKQ